MPPISKSQTILSNSTYTSKTHPSLFNKLLVDRICPTVNDFPTEPVNLPSSDSIDLHVRSYRSALKSNQEIAITSLVNSHLKMVPILHPFGEHEDQIDAPALIYSLLRLPKEINQTDSIILGQNLDVFTTNGFTQVENWPKVGSPARRRHCRFSLSARQMAVFVASISDVDDVINLLITYQLEMNKLHRLFRHLYPDWSSLEADLDNQKIARNLNLDQADWQKLETAFGSDLLIRLSNLYTKSVNQKVRLLAGSWVDYTKTTQKWWKNIAKTVSTKLHISRQQVYFVSSNSHSLVNLITGFALKNRRLILAKIKNEHPPLWAIWQKIQDGEHPLLANDFLYFASRFYLADPKAQKSFLGLQKKLGIITIPASHYLDVPVQLIPLSCLTRSPHLDGRISQELSKRVALSSAYIFNIDYPLGFAAYHILSETLENVAKVKGLYIIGKAAVLNSEIGDIQIPRQVYDEHTKNTYLFDNCFNRTFPFVNRQGSVLTQQKAVSVLGTFLENQALIDAYSQNDLTIVEMENGPYMGAVAEATYDHQVPRRTLLDLNHTPFDIGIINYTSDTPYSKAKNLGSTNLSLNGIEPVYLACLAVINRILEVESSFL